jgi:hypothetical protein
VLEQVRDCLNFWVVNFEFLFLFSLLYLFYASVKGCSLHHWKIEEVCNSNIYACIIIFC